jgi:Domain of unknown function (DUF5710)
MCKIALNVPSCDVDAAKERGARWNPAARMWFVDNPAAYDSCCKWTRGPSPWPPGEYRRYRFVDNERARRDGFVWSDEFKCHVKKRESKGYDARDDNRTCEDTFDVAAVRRDIARQRR